MGQHSGSLASYLNLVGTLSISISKTSRFMERAGIVKFMVGMGLTYVPDMSVSVEGAHAQLYSCVSISESLVSRDYRYWRKPAAKRSGFKKRSPR